MTIAVAQCVFADDGGFAFNGPTRTVTITTAANSYIHLGIIWETASGQTITSVASSPSLTWTAGNSIPDSADDEALADYASSITSATTYTITISFSPNATVKGAAAKEITGSSGYDTGSKAGQNQATPGTGTDGITTGNTPGLSAQPALISGYAMNMGSVTPGPTSGTGFTDDGNGWDFGLGSGNRGGRAESKRVTSTAALAATFTAGSNVSHSSVAMVFLETGAGGTGPTINTQPTNQRGYVGATATFSITATTSGGSLSYQWKANGSNVGTNSSSYTTAAGTLSDNGTIITCVVTDSNGSTTSANAFWFVDPVSTVAWIQA